jgi:predicted dehydrogenase
VKIGVALVGPGRIATAHLSAIRKCPDLADLVAVVGLPPEQQHTEELARRFEARLASSDLEAVLSDPSIHAIVLTVPNHLHCPIAVKALAAGKHVLVEKPLAISTAEADAMIEAARAAQRILMVGQCRRFFPAIEQARSILPELGRPLDIIHVLGHPIDTAPTSWWRSPDNAGGGPVLWVNGPHFVDTALWFAGDGPSRIHATAATYNCGQWQGADQLTAILSFADGSTATGHLSFNMRPQTNDQWIVGPGGTLRIVDNCELFLDGSLLARHEREDYLLGDTSFRRQFEEFAGAIAQGRAPLSSAEEGRATVAVLSGIERAVALGSTLEP